MQELIKPHYFEQVLEMFDQGLLQQEIADIIGIKKQALAFQMKKFGFSFKRASYRMLDSQIDEAVRMYSEGMSAPEIGTALGVSKSNVNYALNLRGVAMKTKKEIKFYKKYSINEDAFLDLTTEQSAYFYGWILTDGWVSKANVSIELSRKDEELLLNFKSYMGSSNKIYQRSKVVKVTGNVSEMSSFGFSHEPILNRLKELGLKERKSLKEVCPDVFKYNRHFWRGVVEGDGHIAKSDSYSVEICGSEELCSAFENYCKSLCPEAHVYRAMNGKMFVAKIGRKSSTNIILNELYRDCTLKLSRKYNVYLERYCDGIDFDRAS
jgi:transposase-like protein